MKLDLTPEFGRELACRAGYAQGIAAAHAARVAQALAERQAAGRAVQEAGLDDASYGVWADAADRYTAVRDEAAAAATGAAGWNLAYLMATGQPASEAVHDVAAAAGRQAELEAG